MDRWFSRRSNNNAESSRRNERRERDDRNERRERTDRVESGSSRRNDILQETYREQPYQYTGISASELARRELEPGERQEQENLRQLFHSEWNNLHREHAQLRRELEEDFSRESQDLRQDFERENTAAAQHNEETRQGTYDFLQENPHFSEEHRQRVLNEIEDEIRQYEQDIADEHEQRTNSLLEHQQLQIENMNTAIQDDIHNMEQDQQRRMNELVARQNAWRQARTEQYEDIITNFRRVNEQDNDSDELSL